MRLPALKNRILTLMIYNLVTLSVLYIFSLLFRLMVCFQGPCAVSPISSLDYFLYFIAAIFRPLFFAPAFTFLPSYEGAMWPFVLYASNATLGVVIPYLAGFMLNKYLIGSWLTANIPATHAGMRKNWYKIVIALRLLPVISIDFFSLLFGVFRFNFWGVLFFTFVSELIGGLTISIIGSGIYPGVAAFVAWACLLGVVFFVVRHEITKHAQKLGIYDAALAIYQEIRGEIVVANSVEDEGEEPDKEVILLSYGFFSSRKSALQMKKMLTEYGYEVRIPKLPGLFGVFNTEGIDRAADTLELECRRLSDDGRIFHIVGFSKGALVASYMLARSGNGLGASSYISMGAPYSGSSLTYLLLFTPLGFIWHDVWDMRPGSSILSFIQANFYKVSGSLRIASLYSARDMVAGVDAAITFAPNTTIKTDLEHFDYLVSPYVADFIARFVGARF